MKRKYDGQSYFFFCFFKMWFYCSLYLFASKNSFHAFKLNEKDDMVSDSYEKTLKRTIEAINSKANQLDLSSLDLTSLPLEIGRLTNLQTLYIRGNQLTSLPPEIGQLTNLQTLDRNPTTRHADSRRVFSVISKC